MLQQTEAWFAARAGKVTASRFQDILPGKSGKYLKSRQDYMRQLIAERLTGKPKDQVKAKQMDWGNEQEAAAVFNYEMETGETVNLSGFITHAAFPDCGASADGYVGDDGLIEIKCPFDPAVHIAYMEDGLGVDHNAQMQGNLWVAGRQWIDFISYCPLFPEEMKMYRQRFIRDERFTSILAAEVQIFLSELHMSIAGLKHRYGVVEETFDEEILID